MTRGDMSALLSVRETVADWLRSGEIEVFIGYEAGTVPLRATPTFIRKPEDVDRLIWDATCENNLVAFLPKYRGKKVGIMVKGCDSRAIVGLLQEGQVIRENLRIVGVHCPGVVDVRRVAAQLGVPVENIDDARIEGEQVIVGEQTLALRDVLFAGCQTCVHHAPAVYDVTLGEPVADSAEGDPFAHVREMEALSADERWARFAQELERCNLCFACRNACPMCYCNICFVDRTMPRWFNQTTQPEDKQFYQIIRTFHLAGRCVGCGACTRACPQGINIRLFLDKLRADVQELYGYDAGEDAEAKPPLTTYREDDYNDFIL
jgi:formate dehydrogenase subunit beta